MSLKEQIIDSSKEHLGSLEAKLSGLMKPVAPRPEFVNSLRHRIQITGHPAWVSRFNNIQFVVILVTGVLSMVVLTSMIARALVNLLGAEKKSSEISE